MRYIADNTTPEITNFDLDMNEGLLTITFTEVINISSINVQALTLQNSSVLSSNEFHIVQYGNSSFETLVVVSYQ